MENYQLTGTPDFVLRLDGVSIPVNSATLDSQEYVAWLSAGNIPDPLPLPTPEQLAAEVRAKRDARIATVAWRYERHARELRLGLPLSDDLATLDTYVHALADVPAQSGFPASVDWPVMP